METLDDKALLSHVLGKPEWLRPLHAYWPHMSVPVRQAMAAGKVGYRFRLQE
jgi:hypothetical protein